MRQQISTRVVSCRPLYYGSIQTRLQTSTDTPHKHLSSVLCKKRFKFTIQCVDVCPIDCNDLATIYLHLFGECVNEPIQKPFVRGRTFHHKQNFISATQSKAPARNILGILWASRSSLPVLDDNGPRTIGLSPVSFGISKAQSGRNKSLVRRLLQ